MAKPGIPTDALDRFRDAASHFASVPASRVSRLLPLKQEIADLRAKGASYRTIAELLGQCGIPVSDTCVNRFCQRELSHQPSRGPRRKLHAAPKKARGGPEDAASPIAGNHDASITASLHSDPKGPPASSVTDAGPRIARIEFATSEDP
jgi:hypothetical protein